jgi:hypothetical protein
MEIFYAATTITIGTGCKTPFWEAPWLDGRARTDIAPLIFDISKRKSWKVNQAMKENGWVRKINLTSPTTLEHLAKFIDLWVRLQSVHVLQEVDDDISWKLTHYLRAPHTI